MSKSNKEKRRLLNIRNYKNGKEELSTDSIKIKLMISFVDDNFINFYLDGNNNYSLNLGKDNKHFKKRIKRFYKKTL